MREGVSELVEWMGNVRVLGMVEALGERERDDRGRGKERDEGIGN